MCMPFRLSVCFEMNFVLILLNFLNVFSGNYASRLIEKESEGYVPLTTEEIFEKYAIQM